MTLGPTIAFYLDREVNAEMDTSCDTEIGPGFKSGYFEVVRGYSLYGMLLCPVRGM